MLVSSANGIKAPSLFGVNPWRLQTWMGHKRIDETMLYVHVAEAHARELPEAVHEAGLGQADPDARIIAMLGARGQKFGKTEGPKTKTQPSWLRRSCAKGDSNPHGVTH